MKLSVGFLTGRTEPRLHWVLDAIAAQSTPEDQIDVVVIDALEHLRSNDIVGSAELDVLARAPWIDLRIAPVRPNLWQGRHRIAPRDWWATAASRNTFLCLARHDYIAFLDDCCRPGPHWMETVRQGERERSSVLAGSFDKLEGPERAVSTSVRDHRRELFPSGLLGCGGGWLYGCTFCLPLDWALDVNGFEEGCDGLAGEDYMFGLMLDQHPRRIDFCPDLYVVQERELGDESCLPVFHKRTKGTPPNDKSTAALARFGSRLRTEFTPDLRELRRALQHGEPFPIPDPDSDPTDWYDGQRVREMTD